MASSSLIVRGFIKSTFFSLILLPNVGWREEDVVDILLAQLETLLIKYCRKHCLLFCKVRQLSICFRF